MLGKADSSILTEQLVPITFEAAGSTVVLFFFCFFHRNPSSGLTFPPPHHIFGSLPFPRVPSPDGCSCVPCSMHRFSHSAVVGIMIAATAEKFIEFVAPAAGGRVVVQPTRTRQTHESRCQKKSHYG